MSFYTGEDWFRSEGATVNLWHLRSWSQYGIVSVCKRRFEAPIELAEMLEPITDRRVVCLACWDHARAVAFLPVAR